MKNEDFDLENEKRKTQLEAIEKILEPAQLNNEKAIEEKIEKTFTEVGMPPAKPVIDTHQIDMTTAVIGAAGVTAALAAQVGKDVYDKAKDYMAEKFTEKDAAKEWEKDINKKEADLNDKHSSLLQTLEQNKVMQESQLKDSKKDGYEEKLTQLNTGIDKEKAQINDKFIKDTKEIDKEKQALQNAIDSTKGLQGNERNQEIEKQRKEFDRQQELERKKEQERNR